MANYVHPVDGVRKKNERTGDVDITLCAMTAKSTAKREHYGKNQ